MFYILVTGMSLPGATLLTLVAGALFGLWLGTLIVSFASTLGATTAFVISRYLFRDATRRKFGKYLTAIDRGVEREGAFYLFALRLVPAVPFFAINLAMAQTAISTWRFYWVSQLGMIFGTVVYVNAGSELGQIQSLSDIFSPTLWISFALLGFSAAHSQEAPRLFQSAASIEKVQETEAVRQQPGRHRCWFRGLSSRTHRYDRQG